MQTRYKIAPHLWFDKQAKEAANFYCSLFPQSKVKHSTTIHNTPSGDCDLVSFDLWGQPFMAISAGPLFRFNPSVSFMVNFDSSKDPNAEAQLNNVWEKLSDGGTALMPLGEYPFSKRYGWIKDKYGLSWQLILSNPDGEERPFIVPSLLFTESAWGKAEEAVGFYINVFKEAQRGGIHRYPAGMEPDKEGTVMFSDFMIEGQWFAAMDSAREHGYTFNEAISFLINCDTQEEIDYYWEKLSAVPESEQCGWCKDQYGVSWQVSPSKMQEMMSKGTPEQIDRVTQAFLKMKKFNIEELERAYKGELAGV
jgi:predicted 3-demethylubiquinone-9 3-methyltransferase (glyoxalase superfamily)